jgi:hypothetical protein
VARARECMGGETQFRVLRVVLGDSMELFTSGGGHSSTLRERVLRGKEADVRARAQSRSCGCDLEASFTDPHTPSHSTLARFWWTAGLPYAARERSASIPTWGPSEARERAMRGRAHVGSAHVRPRRPQGGFGGSPPDSPRFGPLLPQQLTFLLLIARLARAPRFCPLLPQQLSFLLLLLASLAPLDLARFCRRRGAAAAAPSSCSLCSRPRAEVLNASATRAQLQLAPLTWPSMRAAQSSAAQRPASFPFALTLLRAAAGVAGGAGESREAGEGSGG